VAAIVPDSRDFQAEFAPVFSLPHIVWAAGSNGEQHATTQQVGACAAVYLPLEKIEFRDLALGLSVTPVDVSAARTVSPSCSSPFAKVSVARTPHVRALPSHVSKGLQGLIGSALRATPRERTSSQTCRVNAMTRADSSPYSMRANVAASVEVSSSGRFTHSHANCFGEASGSGRVPVDHQLPPG